MTASELTWTCAAGAALTEDVSSIMGVAAATTDSAANSRVPSGQPLSVHCTTLIMKHRVPYWRLACLHPAQHRLRLPLLTHSNGCQTRTSHSRVQHQDVCSSTCELTWPYAAGSNSTNDVSKIVPVAAAAINSASSSATSDRILSGQRLSAHCTLLTGKHQVPYLRLACLHSAQPQLCLPLPQLRYSNGCQARLSHSCVQYQDFCMTTSELTRTCAAGAALTEDVSNIVTTAAAAIDSAPFNSSILSGQPLSAHC